MLQKWNNSWMISNTPRIRNYLLPGLLAVLIGCSQKAPVAEITKQPLAQQLIMTPEVIEENAKHEKQNLYQLGLDALKSHDYDNAKTLFMQFIETYPGIASAYVNLALIAYRQEDFKTTEILVAQAIGINPSQAQAYHLRAQLHLNNGDIKKARDDYIQAITLKQGYTNAHYNLALLYDIYLQEIELAIEQYSIYLSLLDKEDEATKDWTEHLRKAINNG